MKAQVVQIYKFISSEGSELQKTTIEERDMLSRSTKKFKRGTGSPNCDIGHETEAGTTTIHRLGQTPKHGVQTLQEDRLGTRCWEFRKTIAYPWAQAGNKRILLGY